MPQSVIAAAYVTVHAFPGGATALAPFLDKNPATLSHEVSGTYSGAKLGLDDAVKIQQITQDPRILFAMAEALGFGVIRRPESATGELEPLLQSFAHLAKEMGDASQAFYGAVADGVISETEVRDFEKQLADIAIVGAGVAAAMREKAKQDRASAQTLRAVKA